MKHKLTTLATVLILAGCASSGPTKTEIVKDQLAAKELQTSAEQKAAEATLSTMPAWVINPPKSDEVGVYGVGIGESKKVDVAMKKGQLNAQYELAKSFGQALSGNERSYIKDGSVGSTDDYTQLIDSIVAEVPINGYEVIENKVVAENGKFTNYTLMRLTYDQFGKGLTVAEQKSTDEKIKSEFSDLYQRLDSIKQN
ncbi:hypothetical protein [Vibrio sp. 10N]|uniref:hypothetical protein n=1 Tax=Vibrio sp. 10N TaxID=3058938 RepID=UPI002814227C|nr:hypothetical protein VB10N_46570 [Vibrio sp. 10N]